MQNFNKTLKKTLEPFLFCVLLALSALLAVDKRYSKSVLDGLLLWAGSVLPAVFPYFFISSLLSSLSVTQKLANGLSPFTGRLFFTGGITGYAFIMSVLSGYPVGAKMISEFKENGFITKTECERASAFCSTPSPMFLIGSVGNLMFNDFKFGLFLFLTCLISAILTGIVFSFYKRNERPSQNARLCFKPVDNLLYESAYSSVISVLVIGGLIALFFTLTEILLSIGVLTPIIKILSLIFKDEKIAKSVALGLIECTKGLKTLTNAPFGFWTLPIASCIAGFGGLSVITQSLAYLKKAKIKTAVFLFAKGVSAVLCFSIGCLFSFLL